MAKKESLAGVPVGKFVEEYLVEPRFDADGVQATSGIGSDGKEYPDPVPMSPPVGYDAPPDLMTMIRQMVRSEQFIQALEKNEMETFEEADDFDIDDDDDDFGPTEYERIFEPLPEVNAVEVKKEEKKPAVASPPAGSEKDSTVQST